MYIYNIYIYIYSLRFENIKRKFKKTVVRPKASITLISMSYTRDKFTSVMFLDSQSTTLMKIRTEDKNISHFMTDD